MLGKALSSIGLSASAMQHALRRGALSAHACHSIHLARKEFHEPINIGVAARRYTRPHPIASDIALAVALPALAQPAAILQKAMRPQAASTLLYRRNF